MSRIQFDERFGLCEASVVQISQKMPPAMDGHVPRADWEAYCSKIDKDLKGLTAIRGVMSKILFVYAVLVVAWYLCAEVFNLFDDMGFRSTDIVTEILLSAAVFLGIMFLYLFKARYSVIRAVKRHTQQLNHGICPDLKMRPRLPFCQFSGRIVAGWYIEVELKKRVKDVERGGK